jgi:hypothetical protein
MTKHWDSFVSHCIFDVNHKKAPTLAQITLRLAESKDNSNEAANIIDWIADGIKIENDQ